MSINELVKRIGVIKGRYDSMVTNREDYTKRIEQAKTRTEELSKAIDVLYNFNIWLNEQAKTRLESITNEALKLIFPDKIMTFHVVANQTKKGVSYELNIETDGVTTDILDAKGGGVLDIIQTCLRITYLLKMKNRIRQFLLFDEPFKNLDSERVNSAIEWLNRISDIFGIQMLIITHIPSLIIPNDNNVVYEMSIKGGHSEIRRCV